MEKAMEWGNSIPIGILYKEEKESFHEKIDFLRDGKPLVDKEIDPKKISQFMKDFM